MSKNHNRIGEDQFKCQIIRVRTNRVKRFSHFSFWYPFKGLFEE